jgi:hypothetical protein
MSSPDQSPEDETCFDELDHLVRRALQALVSQQEPPERVWKSIRRELERDEGPPRRLQMPWLPLVLQPALTLLIVVLGGITLQAVLHPEDMHTLPIASSPPVAIVYVDEGSAFSATATLQDKDELRSLKVLSNPSSGRQLGFEPANEPPLIMPRDPAPNVLSPEGRVLTAEFSRQRLAVEDRRGLHSGPYQWSR